MKLILFYNDRIDDYELFEFENANNDKKNYQ